jgi:hypothetical protein
MCFLEAKMKRTMLLENTRTRTNDLEDRVDIYSD